MALTLVTGPVIEPVGLQEAKDHLRVDITADDALIEALIMTARDWIEQRTRRALMTQTWNYVVDEFPTGDKLTLPMPPLQSVVSITYKDQDGDASTFSAADYIVDTDADPGKVVLAYGASWPSTTLYPTGAVTMQFIGGYGDTADDVPRPVRQAVLLLCGHLYENREAIVATGAVPKELPFAVNALLWPYRMMTRF